MKLILLTVLITLYFPYLYLQMKKQGTGDLEKEQSIMDRQIILLF